MLLQETQFIFILGITYRNRFTLTMKMTLDGLILLDRTFIIIIYQVISRRNDANTQEGAICESNNILRCDLHKHRFDVIVVLMTAQRRQHAFITLITHKNSWRC